MSRSRTLAILLAVLLVGVLALPAVGQTVEEPTEDPIPHLLMFSGTYGFRHGSIEHSIEVVTSLAESTGAFTVTATEDPAAFTAEAFEQTDIILFANTTGETPFSDEQRAMFEQWVRDGGGFMGIHAAADTNYEWPFYQELVGAAFESHPHTGMTLFATEADALDEATVQVENADHPIHADTTVESFPLREEYYRWREDPRGTQDVRVLLSLDETSTTSLNPPHSGLVNPAYEDDQPVEWVKSYRGLNRAWYTNLGHYDATYDREDWQDRFLNAVEWVFEGEHVAPGTPEEPTPSSDVDGAIIAPPGAASTTFVPVAVIQQGGETTLYNLDNVEHNVQSRAVNPATRRPFFTSSFAAPLGGTVPVEGTADLAPGDYEFFCTIHGAMEGTLTVL